MKSRKNGIVVCFLSSDKLLQPSPLLSCHLPADSLLAPNVLYVMLLRCCFVSCSNFLHIPFSLFYIITKQWDSSREREWKSVEWTREKPLESDDEQCQNDTYTWYIVQLSLHYICWSLWYFSSLSTQNLNFSYNCFKNKWNTLSCMRNTCRWHCTSSALFLQLTLWRKRVG